MLGVTGIVRKLIYFRNHKKKLRNKKYKNTLQKDIYFFEPVMEITTKIGCSIACNACPQTTMCKNYYKNEKGRAVSEMSFQAFKCCVDKLPHNCILDFSGMAEPFLNKRCADMICYAYEKGHRINLYTTLVGMDLKSFHKIKNIPFDNVVLHIPDNRGNAHISLTEDYFKILDAVLRTKRKDGNPFVTGLSCHGYPQEDVRKHLKRYGFRKPKPDHMIDRAGNLNGNGGVESCKLSESVFCSRSFSNSHNVLLPDGSVLLCCMDYGMQHVLGNLMRQSYTEIMQSAEKRNVKADCDKECFNSVLCKKCTAAVKYSSIRLPEGLWS